MRRALHASAAAAGVAAMLGLGYVLPPMAGGSAGSARTAEAMAPVAGQSHPPTVRTAGGDGTIRAPVFVVSLVEPAPPPVAAHEAGSPVFPRPAGLGGAVSPPPAQPLTLREAGPAIARSDPPMVPLASSRAEPAAALPAATRHSVAAQRDDTLLTMLFQVLRGVEVPAADPLENAAGLKHDFVRTGRGVGSTVFPPPAQPLAALDADWTPSAMRDDPPAIPQMSPDARPPESLPPVTRHAVTIHRGDSLLGVLRGVDISAADALQAVAGLEPGFNPARLRVGSRVEFVIDTPVETSEEKGSAQLLDLRIVHRGKTAETVHVWHGASYEGRRVVEIVDGMAGIAHSLPSEEKSEFFTATISSSFYRAARRAGISSGEVAGMVKILEGSIDFRRDLRAGDQFEALVARDNAGGSTIHFVGLRNGSRNLAFYRVEFADGSSGYFDSEGNPHSNLISTRPLGGARVTSGFGYRIHPIRKVRHLHRGADFRAASGTPVPAAGAGVVVQKGWRGGYGRYLRIRHNSTYMTAYAHLRAFARGIAVGSRVKRDQIIGYVGSSGLSTGPHLHFEVIRDGRHIDPLKLRRVPAARLVDERLADFLLLRDRVEAQLDENRTRSVASLP